MKIGIISDTHSLNVPEKLISDLKNTDLIIHAGDFCSIKEYKFFAQLKAIKAVYGNCDETQLVKKLPEKDIFEIDGVCIGVFHGEGSMRMVFESVRRKFKKDQVDVIVFGHSHNPMITEVEGVTYINPGSPTDTITAPYCSYGLLNIEAGKFKAEIIKI